MSVISFFDRGWRQSPDAPAYIMGGRSWSYDDVHRGSSRIARAILGMGERVRHVGVLSANDPAAWVGILGAWRAGGVWVPLNVAYPAKDTAHAINGFDVDLVFFQASSAGLVEEISALVERPVQWICLDDDGTGNISLGDWSGHLSDDPLQVGWEPDDVVAIMPTGGTTGKPKGVMNTHRTLAASITHMMLVFAYRADEPIINLAAAPMTHAAGLLTLPCLARGGTVVVLPRADAGPVLTALEQTRATEVFLPPTALYRLLDLPRLDQADIGSLRYLLYGAAPIALPRLREAVERLGPVLMGGYGQMEAPMAISYLTPPEHMDGGSVADDAVLGSCGRPLPLVQVEIRDDSDRPVPTNQVGEICVRGDLVMKGYYRRPDLTAETIIEGWLHTGDIGRLDDHGRLTISDRKKDMIISGGSNVYPSEVETVLAGHPAVLESAVVGVPDDEWGERVVAFVELRPGVDPVDGPALVAWGRERLGGIRAPKQVVIVAALPRSAAGKILKAELRGTRNTQRALA
ncbi:class I adenylate-forming enzyme family protein [Aeromicrobium wangtongii]|uniref:AMP-binding protein n=1 Tax=Aeromicrobium wangtongii TaxID=2969247 RepID=A0ABY5MDS9_9ACTN|nr:AMP-binding protein [Aeromicrobium wangtongii]MCD9197691.1 AMP-binding protein [Aeromicrobium wangtongii]UUP15175.1 AMP-binding protein [Aeromicrobium wangtongii]